MQLTALPLSGAWLIDLEPHRDDRGYFARLWDADDLRAVGLFPPTTQTSVAASARQGTLRGLHYQVAPQAETKVIACVRGAIWDVIVDLRPDSPTFRKWEGIQLSAEQLRAIYVPEGFAHGYLTLTEDVLTVYQISPGYSADHARGVRWDDPAFGISWPEPPTLLSERDGTFPDFDVSAGA